MATTSLDPHHRPLVQVYPVDPTAILRAQQVPSATTAHHAQVLVAVHVNATVLHAEATESSSTAEVHVVATATIQAHVVPPAPIARKNIYLGVLADTVWWSDDDEFLFRIEEGKHMGRSFVTAISSLQTKAASSWS